MKISGRGHPYRRVPTLTSGEAPDVWWAPMPMRPQEGGKPTSSRTKSVQPNNKPTWNACVGGGLLLQQLYNEDNYYTLSLAKSRNHPDE